MEVLDVLGSSHRHTGVKRGSWYKDMADNLSNGVCLAPVVLGVRAHKVQALEGGVAPPLDLQVGCAEGGVHCLHNQACTSKEDASSSRLSFC